MMMYRVMFALALGGALAACSGSSKAAKGKKAPHKNVHGSKGHQHSHHKTDKRPAKAKKESNKAHPKHEHGHSHPHGTSKHHHHDHPHPHLEGPDGHHHPY